LSNEQTALSNNEKMLALSYNLEQALELIKCSTKLAHTSCSGINSTLTTVLATHSTLTTALAKCSINITEAQTATTKLAATLKSVKQKEKQNEIV